MLNPKPNLAPSADLLDALELVKSGQWTADDYKAWDAGRIVKRRPEPPPVRWAISQKGGVSVYNLQRMPITLYANQWEKLAEHMPQIMAFIEENRPALATKDKPQEPPKASE